MTRQLTLALVVLLTVASCGRIAESRFNPFNWFGRDRGANVTVVEGQIRDPRPLVDQVVSISIDRAPGGAILTARGLPLTQGFWDGDLLLQARRDGVLVYHFRAAPPETRTRISTATSREVVVAEFLTDQTLGGIREIQVLGARNARAVRR